MAYTQAFKVQGPLGYPQPLSGGGVQAIDATSLVQNYPLGTRIRAIDPVLGEAEFLYAKGVASTAATELIQINGDYSTVRAAGGTIKGLCGIAMSANIAGPNYGWYCIFGAVLCLIAGDVTGDVPAYTTATAGVLADDIVAGSQVVGSQLMNGLDAGGSAIPGTALLTAAHQTVVRLQYPAVVKAV
jgi:hypothetical protein